MIKMFNIIRDCYKNHTIDGVLPITENEILEIIDGDNLIMQVTNSEPGNNNYYHQYRLKLTYYSNVQNSGCCAWVKIKKNESIDHYTYIAINPKYIDVDVDNIISISGARLFDDNFSVSIEKFSINLS